MTAWPWSGLSALLLYAVSAAMAAARFRSERLRAGAGIFAAFVPVPVGLAAPVVALLFIVVMPVFYAVTAEGLKSRQIAGPDPRYPG
jgi:hypothetical protein